GQYRGRQARAASARPATRNATPMSWTKSGLKGPVSDTPGTLSYQSGLAASIASPLKRVGIARIAAIRRRMGTSCAQDEAGGPGVTELAKENFRAISGPNSRPKRSAIWSEFCPWQAGQDSVNNGFRAC